ncbi:hypothetical protein [Coxiella-like endosymbiont of Rhipicephalus sanguineus]|nr:hypothetical protein [Coxiella-like endosymbiont of Rhipicephalus sanguineus]
MGYLLGFIDDERGWIDSYFCLIEIILERASLLERFLAYQK